MLDSEATHGNTAHARFMLNKEDYARAQTCTRPRARAPKHTHAFARTHARTHTEIRM
jgi:hypothetical protein